MIDVGDKRLVKRRAVASGRIRLSERSIEAVRGGRVKKGDTLECARVAATLAVKKVPDLVPYCHHIPIDEVIVGFSIDAPWISCDCEVRAHYRTGVEMEALMGVQIALLTIWDMVKYIEKDESGQYPITEICGVKVLTKEKGIYDKNR